MTRSLEGSDLAIELATTQAVCEAIGTPRALTVSLLIQHQEWDQLLSLEIKPEWYQHAGNFADDYLATKLLSKSDLIPSSVDTEAAARSAFFEAEAYNRSTNERFSMTDAVDHPDWWWRCQKYLRRVMGPLDLPALNQISDLMQHGSGSVVGLYGELVPSIKYDMTPTVTEGLLPYCDAILTDTWREMHALGKGPRVVKGNQFFTVRKNAIARRGCAKGPLLNVYAQMGVGRYLAKRLRYFGCDIHDQGFNQYLAARAQEWGLATLDLKSASDLGARIPYLMLMSDRWGDFLSVLREEYTEVDPVVGQDRVLWPLEKFSAMGNGFTFPLQTAIFISVIRAIVPPDLHGLTVAYGDDLVLPREYALEVIAALEYLGFKVNQSKSCLAGNFFESCGTDWFNGQNVRPIFLRRERRIDSELALDDSGPKVFNEPGIPYVVQIANALREWTQRRAAIDGKTGCDSRFRHVWSSLVASCPRKWRVPIPRGFGDSGLVTSFEESFDKLFTSTPRSLLEWPRGKTVDGVVVDGWEGIVFRRMRVRPHRVERRSFGVLLSALAGERDAHYQRLLGVSVYDIARLRDLASYGQEPVRGLFGQPVPSWAIIPCWPDGLDWVDLT